MFLRVFIYQVCACFFTILHSAPYSIKLSVCVLFSYRKLTIQFFPLFYRCSNNMYIQEQKNLNTKRKSNTAETERNTDRSKRIREVILDFIDIGYTPVVFRYSTNPVLGTGRGLCFYNSLSRSRLDRQCQYAVSERSQWRVHALQADDPKRDTL